MLSAGSELSITKIMNCNALSGHKINKSCSRRRLFTNLNEMSWKHQYYRQRKLKTLLNRQSHPLRQKT